MSVHCTWSLTLEWSVALLCYLLVELVSLASCSCRFHLLCYPLNYNSMVCLLVSSCRWARPSVNQAMFHRTVFLVSRYTMVDSFNPWFPPPSWLTMTLGLFRPPILISVGVSVAAHLGSVILTVFLSNCVRRGPWPPQPIGGIRFLQC